MANWSLPTLTDLYANFRQYISDRLDDAAKMFDSALVTAINLPTGTKRWNSSGSKWEKLSGTTWSDMAAVYGISISGNAATATTAGTAGSVTTVTSANVISGLGYTPLNKAGGTVTGALTVSGLITGWEGLTITGNMYASGSIHTAGAAQFDTTLGVNGAVTVGGSISCTGQIASNNAALRANGCWDVATDGIVYFGSRYSYIYKHGNTYKFYLEDIGTAVITKGGTVAMTSDIPAAGVSKDQGATNIGSYACLALQDDITCIPGSTYSGSVLYSEPTKPSSGTWRCLEYSGNRVVLFQRIA